MKYIVLIRTSVLLFLFSCQLTGNCQVKLWNGRIFPYKTQGIYSTINQVDRNRYLTGTTYPYEQVRV